jgi:hypothetical protein
VPIPRAVPDVSTTTCPAGHASATTDYCDTCGMPIGAVTTEPDGGASAEPSASGGESTPDACPGCGEPVVGRFCESCGYDVESGTPAGPAPVTLALGADRAHWERMVGEGEPAFPAASPTLSFELTGERAVLGRVRPGREPDVDLPLTGAAADPAVSHHQCVFEKQDDVWTVRDAGSSNGTWLNDADQPLGAEETHVLVSGDRIHIGAWTRLTVQIGTGPAAGAEASDPGTD